MVDVEIAPQDRVLLVNAEPASLELWLDAIAEGELTVHAAATGDDAIAHAILHQPDVIVLNGAVDKTSVLKAYQQLKAIPSTADVPILILVTDSSLTSMTSIQSALQSKDDLVSPFQAQTLLPLVRTLISVRQLRQRVRLQTQELRAVTNCRQQTEKALRSLLYAMSHDLRNPTLGMQMVVKNLLEGVGVESQSCTEVVSIPRSILERMVQGIECHIKQIDCLLDAHSCTAAPLALQCQLIQLEELMVDIGTSLQPLIAKNQAALTYHISPDLPPVYGDPCQIRRVFEHLITNALKHNSPGIELAIAARAEGNMVRCSVKDNGVGIPADQCQQLFGLHQRGANVGHTNGLGVGLYLCQQIIQAHRGKMSVSSAPYSGALFWFELPIYNEGDETKQLVVQTSQPLG